MSHGCLYSQSYFYNIFVLLVTTKVKTSDSMNAFSSNIILCGKAIHKPNKTSISF